MTGAAAPVGVVARGLLADGRLSIPLPGSGKTPVRHRQLFAWGLEDQSLGRLVEAHTDALAILAAAGREPAPDVLYGVWAAERPQTGLRVVASGSCLRLHGTKDFCGGLGICDRALVTATDHPAADAGPQLVEVDLRSAERSGSLSWTTERWLTPAFADTNTGCCRFEATALAADALVGPPGWYLDRPGFWPGAVGPAAVWAGGAAALVDHAEAHARPDAHSDAHLGALLALRWQLVALLDTAGREIDADRDDRTGRAEARALAVRHLVERTATEVIDRFGRLLGPAPMVGDAAVVRRVAELSLAVRQTHAEADLAELARTQRAGRAAGGPT